MNGGLGALEKMETDIPGAGQGRSRAAERDEFQKLEERKY